jgi:iron(III) transport system permease protein
MTTNTSLHNLSRDLRFPSGWSLVAIIIAMVLAIPIIGIAWSIFQPGQGNWPHLVETVLPQYIQNSLILMLGVGIGVSVLGVGTAWLVVMCRFPGRGLFEWSLILPLAVPAYVVAYAYTDVLQVAGPVQGLIRDTFELRFGQYWFPEIRSIEGAIVIFSAVLYPYVYLLARAAFLEQSICALDAARTLGRTPWGAFRSVALPLARPAIVAGTALALMETLADFGTVAHFGIPTFATGIYRTWTAMGDQIAAAQLSSVLLLFIILLVWIERMSRKQAKYHHTTGRYQAIDGYRLTGFRAIGAIIFCVLPLIVGFLAPLIMLLWMHFTDGHDLFSPRYIDMIINSVTLAGITAFLAVLLSLFLVYVARSEKSWLTRISNRIVSLGYAVPGSMIAVGILIPLATLDNFISDFLDRQFGISVGLLLTGSIAALVLGYLVRFMTVSMNTVTASLEKVTPNMEYVSRSLGNGPLKTAFKVHVPIISGGLMTAGLIVFVDVMKELPATLIMRPFNFDTLAVQAYNLASDERLAQAATPSLVIVAVGILPLIIMSRAIMRSRPGSK